MTDKDKKKKPAAAPEQADRSTELTAIKSDGEGVIQIANDVVSNIAGLAVMEIEGVSKLTGNITKELITKLGRKSLSKGIKLNFSGRELTVDVSIEVKFGYNIVEVSKSVHALSQKLLFYLQSKNVPQSFERGAGIPEYT